MIFPPGATGTGGIANPIAGIDIVSKAKQSRGEKKARKIMSKLGLKPVSLFSMCLSSLTIIYRASDGSSTQKL